MSIILEFFLAAILAPILAIVVWAGFFFWLYVFAKIMEVLEKRRPQKPQPPPYCDINPLAHPAFVWAPDGRGIIHDVDTGLRANWR